MPEKLRSSAEVRKDMSAIAGQIFSLSRSLGTIAIADGPHYTKLVEIKDAVGGFSGMYEKLQKLDLEFTNAIRAELEVEAVYTKEKRKATKEEALAMDAEVERVKVL